MSPWEVVLGKGKGFPFDPDRRVQVANPASFLAQKILIHSERSHGDRAKDILYVHDTVETFSGNLPELRGIFANEIQGRIHARRVAELTSAAGRLFGGINDTVRESVLMAGGRNLNPEALLETCRAGLKEIFG